VDDLTVLLTAAGSPGASTCIRHLRGIRERRVRVIGVDADREAIGRGLCDGFHAVPPAASPEYPEALLEVARIEGPDVLIPASTFEIETVAPWTDRFEALGVRVLASRPEDLQLANDKHRLYAMFDGDPDVPVPAHRLVRSLEEFLAAVEELGAGGRRLCFKPPRSKGSRGFRYLDGRTSRRSLLLDHKPDNKVMSLEEFRAIFADDPDFPPLLVMEVLEGEEIDSMVIGHEGEALLITHKTRESERGGVITRGEQVERPEIDAAIRAIVRRVPLRYNFGIQFIGGALLEINPRLSTFMYTPDWVEPYFAIKLALGEWTPEDVRAMQAHVPVGLRMVRYFDQHFWVPEPAEA
jgi:carbamoyl-phosphate synthase large subunit